MRILILGGTSFVGRTLAVEAVSRNHEVTLLNRGSTPPPAGTTSLHGDRRSPDGLAALGGLFFDAVIDTWSGEPLVAIRALDELINRTRHYTFISSASVYDPAAIRLDGDLHCEKQTLLDIEAPTASKSIYPFYKRTVEVAVERKTADTPRLVVRPGIILGPHEATTAERGRLTWWLDRIGRGEIPFAPGPQDMSLQFIDVRDLARFVTNAAEDQLQGAYNVANKAGEVTMGHLLNKICHVTGNDTELEWKSPQEVLDSGMRPFSDLPLWLHPDSREYAFLYRLDTLKAQKAGLACRPFEETVQDTWDWMQLDQREDSLGQGQSRPIPSETTLGKAN